MSNNDNFSLVGGNIMYVSDASLATKSKWEEKEITTEE